MLKRADDTRNDIRSLSSMITECLEPHSALQGENRLVSDKWDSILREFQSLMEVKTAAELLKVRVCPARFETQTDKLCSMTS